MNSKSWLCSEHKCITMSSQWYGKILRWNFASVSPAPGVFFLAEVRTAAVSRLTRRADTQISGRPNTSWRQLECSIPGWDGTFTKWDWWGKTVEALPWGKCPYVFSSRLQWWLMSVCGARACAPAIASAEDQNAGFVFLEAWRLFGHMWTRHLKPPWKIYIYIKKGERNPFFPSPLSLSISITRPSCSVKSLDFGFFPLLLSSISIWATLSLFSFFFLTHRIGSVSPLSRGVHPFTCSHWFKL